MKNFSPLTIIVFVVMVLGFSSIVFIACDEDQGGLTESQIAQLERIKRRDREMGIWDMSVEQRNNASLHLTYDPNDMELY